MPSDFVRSVMRIIRSKDWSQNSKGSYMKRLMKAEKELDVIFDISPKGSDDEQELSIKNVAKIHTTGN